MKVKSMRNLLMLTYFILFGSPIFNSSTELGECQIVEKEIKTELLFDIGSNSENEDFYRPEYFTVDSLGNIYILDTGNSRIQCFSSKGKFINSFGSFGQGPGELSQYASKLKLLADGNLYLIDNYQHRVTIYSKDGKYLNSYKTSSPFDDITMKNGRYFLSNIFINKNHKPIHFTRDLNKFKGAFGQIIEPVADFFKTVKVSTTPRILEREFSFMNMTCIIVNSNMEVIYSQRWPYYLVVYNEQGEKIKEIAGHTSFNTHFPLEISFSGKNVKRRVVASPSDVYNIVPLNDDHFIVPVINPERSYIYFDYFDSNVEHVSRYILKNTFFDKNKKEGIVHIHIDQNNNLYCLVVSREDIPRLSKYKILF